MAVEEVPGVVVEVLREVGEDSVTVVVEEVVGAAAVEQVDSVPVGAVVEDGVEIPTSRNPAVSEGVGHRPCVGRSGVLSGIAGCDHCTNINVSSQDPRKVTSLFSRVGNGTAMTIRSRILQMPVTRYGGSRECLLIMLMTFRVLGVP